MTYTFLIPGVIVQVFNPIAELVISIGTTNKEAKTKIEIHPLIVAAKIRKPSTYFRAVQNFFYAFYWSIHFVLFLQGNHFLFCLNFSI